MKLGYDRKASKLTLGDYLNVEDDVDVRAREPPEAIQE